MFGIPQQLLDYMAYDEGNTMLGIANITNPDFDFLTETIKGAGTVGETEVAALGQLSTQSITIEWLGLSDDNVKFIAPKKYHFDFWGSQQIQDLDGGLNTIQVREVVKCTPKKLTLGNFEKAAMMGTSIEFIVNYIKLYIAGKEMLEIDRFNNKFVVGGVDYLEQVRKDIGMA